ncbi:MAG: prepilin-type N-terminal cleavage/methylation domain-containing protein [Xanthomonadales bacterium]|nr:prepilin-type N-terminal cleavage/methylation domain-containing protein [Xanthomonadales bacterium]
MNKNAPSQILLSKHRQRGVGLIEILIALVVLAIGFLALAALQGAVTRNAADSRARAAATLLASEKLEELRSFTASRSDANGDGVPDLIIDLDGDGIGDAVGLSFDQMVSGNDTPAEIDGAQAGFAYTRNWTVTACTMDPTAAVDCAGVTFADADFIRASVQVVWTSVENAGQTDEIMVHDLISSSSPLDAAVALAEPTRSRDSPKVYVTPGRISQTIPIAIGTDLDTAASDPQPTIIRDNIVRTQFEVLTFSNTDEGALAEKILDYTLVGCSCQQQGVVGGNESFEPTYWNGRTYVRPAERVNGEAYENRAGDRVVPARRTASALLRNNDPPDVKLLCTICCRDHHDTANSDAPRLSPWRPDGSRDVNGDGTVDPSPGSPDNQYLANGDHRHYLPVLRNGLYTFTPADNVGDEYYETCRFLRRDGEYALTLDTNLADLVALPNFKLDDASETEGYARYAQAFVDGYVDYAIERFRAGGDYALQPMTPAERDSLYQSARSAAPADTQQSLDPVLPYGLGPVGLQLTARGIFIDYMTPEVLRAIQCKDENDDTSPECLPFQDVSRLELVPFYAVGMTKLVNWRPVDATIATVPLKDRNDPFSRGFVIPGAPGSTRVVADSPVSNIALTNPIPSQPIEVVQTISDDVPVSSDNSTPPPEPPRTIHFSLGIDRDASLPNADVVRLAGTSSGSTCTQTGSRQGRVDWTCGLDSLGQGVIRFDAYTGTECVRRFRGSCVEEAPVRNVLCFAPVPNQVEPFPSGSNAYADYTLTRYNGSQVNGATFAVDVYRATDGCP